MHGQSREASAASPDETAVESARNEAITDTGAEVEAASDAPQTAPSGPADALADAQAEASRMKEAWLRAAADFDNYRKRTRREMEDALRAGREQLLKAVLPVFDNLERAIQSSQRSADVKAVAEGLSMVQRQFVDVLGREGIARVPTVGHAFDPTVHEAIQQVETTDQEPGTVIAEVQPGYRLGDRLVRPAMVIVAKAKSDDGAPGRATDTAS